jgi:hypothetical protein
MHQKTRNGSRYAFIACNPLQGQTPKKFGATFDSEILGNLDKAPKHFSVKWVVDQYETLPVEIESGAIQDLDALVSSCQARFFERSLKHPIMPPDGFLIFDSDGKLVRVSST